MITERRHGVCLDVCDSHGIWLDKGELEAIVIRARRRQALDDNRVTREAAHKAKLAGALFGVWSFLGD